MEGRLQESFFKSFCDCSAACLYPQFAVNVADVVVDGVKTQKDFVGNLFFGETIDKKAEDLFFARREMIIPLRV